MRRISERSFEAAAGENALVRVTTVGTAAARVWLDGQPVGADVKIPFNGTRRLAVLLAGSLGEQATVEIGPAESVILVDVIPVTTHDPFPVQYYEFRAEGK